MPPFRFDNSSARTRHYGNDFGGGGVGGLLLAVSTAGAIPWSNDGGLSWNAAAGLPGAETWQGFAYSPALGYGISISGFGTVASTVDGKNWTNRGGLLAGTGPRRHIRSDALGLFIVVSGNGSGIFVSATGIGGWVAATSFPAWTFGEIGINPLTGRIFVAGNSQIGISDDGQNYVVAPGIPLAVPENMVQIAFDATPSVRTYFSGDQPFDYYTADGGNSFVFIDATLTGAGSTMCMPGPALYVSGRSGGIFSAGPISSPGPPPPSSNFTLRSPVPWGTPGIGKWSNGWNKFIVCGFGGIGARCGTSPDGLTWTDTAAVPGVNSNTRVFEETALPL